MGLAFSTARSLAKSRSHGLAGGTSIATPPEPEDWILFTGNWEDDGVWDDNGIWNDGPISYESYLLAKDYESRLIAEGHAALSDTAFALVLETFQAAEDHGATASGWLFGSEVNIDVELSLNLASGEPSVIPGGTLHANSNTSAGMVALRIEEAGQGLVLEDDAPFFSNHGPYSVLCLGNSIGEDDPVYAEYQLAAYYQTGYFGVAGANGAQLTDYPNSQFLSGQSNGGSATTRDAQCQPMMHWVCLDEDDNLEFYHPSNNGGTPAPFVGTDIESSGLSLANSVYQVPGSISYMMMLRFDGVLDTAARRDIFDRIYAKWRMIGKAVVIVGNSVTISGGTTLQWPRQFQTWGMYNNCIAIRRAQGATRLPKFAPTGYELPGPPPDAFGDVATWPLNFLDWFGGNVFINDDQQNMVGSSQPWTNWVHCHNAFTTHLQTLNEPGTVRGIMCTQIAHAPYTFDGSYTFLPYPAFGDSNWRQVSIATRAATLSDFNNVPTAIADVWTAFNLGYDTPDDGNPPDPLNDYANGDTSLFLPSDPQHPNEDGQMLLFELYRDAYLEVIAL